MFDPNRPPGSGGPGSSPGAGGGPPPGGGTPGVPGAPGTPGVPPGAPGGFDWASIFRNPLTWLGIAGSVLDILARLKAGEAAKELADFNAAMAEARARDALARGAEEESRYRQGVKVLIGSQRAGFAAQGVDVGVGSPVDVTADAAFLGELDALTLRNNARREAWGYRVEAENFRLGGQQAQTAARFGAASTVLGTTTSLLQARYGWGSRA
jgi:hypothetical protein